MFFTQNCGFRSQKPYYFKKYTKRKQKFDVLNPAVLVVLK